MRVLMAAAALLVLVAGAAAGMPAQQPDEPLPDGPGRKILQASCTQCHDLKEVTKFRGYYTRADWRDIVTTMIQYGAKVDEKDVDVLVDYLTKSLGKPEVP